jgi:tetratricopeptide (TPR) repeat protein
LQGQHGRAWGLVAEALDLLKIFDHPSAEAFGLSTIARVTFLLGMEEHRKFATDLANTCTEHGFSYWLATAECYQARQLAQEGKLAEGAALVERGLRRYRESKARWIYPFLMGLAGDIDLMNGNAEQALARLNEALAQSGETGEAWSDPTLLRIRGQALRQLGRPADAEDCFVSALSVAGEQGSRLFEPAIAAELARSWLERGRKAEARRLLRKYCRGLAVELPWVRGASELLSELR